MVNIGAAFRTVASVVGQRNFQASWAATHGGQTLRPINGTIVVGLSAPVYHSVAQRNADTFGR